jgi:general secretion pathway protein E
VQPSIQQNMSSKLTFSDIAEILLKHHLLNYEGLKDLEAQWHKNRLHPLLLISQMSPLNLKGRVIQPEEILLLLAHHWRLEFIHIDPLKIPLDQVGHLIPIAYAERLGIAVLNCDENTLVVATSEPFDRSWIQEIELLTKKKIALKLALPSEIKLLLNEMFVIQKAFKNLVKEQGTQGTEKLRLLREGRIQELDQLVERSKRRELASKDSMTAKIVDWLIHYAHSERASDIHIEPKSGLGLIRFRIDGDLRTVYRLDPEILQMVISRFKILGEMKLDEKRKPQDGGLKRSLDSSHHIEMRLSTLPTNFGEKLVVRIFDKNVINMDLKNLGFSEEDLATWRDLISQPQGIILVTGPTGSGKTTTLYASLQSVATPDVNVCTAEDPIEVEVETFNQVQINPQINLNFSDCIRAFLRQDPDIIMVGEIRDLPTAEMAVQSSLTGHLVFSTLHTNGALATIQRLVDLGVPSFLINSSLMGILAQRLVRQLCPHCKSKIPLDLQKWKSLVGENSSVATPAHSWKSAGCQHCKQTGFKGRICVYELVKMNDNIKRMIHSKIELTELIEKTQAHFTPIRVNAAKKVVEGLTTMDEVLKIVY